MASRRPRPPRENRPAPSTEPRPTRAEEVKVAGFNAVMAVFHKRPDDIAKVFLTEDRIKPAGPLLKWCAQQGRAYKIVPADELGRITESTHHEGICILTRPRRMRTLPMLLEDLRTKRDPGCLVALEDVVNPHNVGAIMRVCAHFGVPAILCLGTTPHTLSTALQRTSEGGSEHVDLVPVDDPRGAFGSLRKVGFRIFAASQHARAPIYTESLPDRTVLLFGSESTGISKDVAMLADGMIRVPGTGLVESLNVSCASTAALSEYWRQHHKS